MNKNEKNNVILGQDGSLEPRNSAESRNCHPWACNARTEELSRIHLLSLRGAVGDVAISCDKVLSSRGRAESSDVVISCDKVLMNIKNPEKTKTVMFELIRYLSRIILYCHSRIKLQFQTENLSQIKKETAEILGSRLSSCPRMTFSTFALAMVLSMGILNESKADCKALKDGWSSSCITLKESGTCGKGCSYTYDSASKTVNITATGNNARISDNNFDSRYYEHNIMPAQKFVINGAVTIGSNAFTSSSEVISGANGALILTGVEHHAFGDYATLSGTIIIPASATFGSIAFHGVTWAEDAKIYCGAEDCRQKMIDSCNAYNGTSYQQRCRNVVDNIVSSGKLLPYPSGCLEMGATGCTKCKNGNFRLNDGECDRLRYTPAEAAEVLHDGSDNTIIMTFKVNR